MTARVLIVDDDLASLRLAQYLLESAGYHTVLAGDGRRGADLALAEPLDLIVCDLELPQLSGPALLSELRATPGWRPVPVIAVTAASSGRDRQAARDAGFDGYLSKPIDAARFVAQLETFLPPSVGGPRS